MYRIISSSSKGNAVLYFDTVLVDCGIPYSLLKPYAGGISLVLLTHIHKDHFNISTIKRLASGRPSLRFGCGEFLAECLTGIRNTDIYQPGKIYDYGQFEISPVVLYHDVPNFGYRIFKDGKKIIHATDTYTLDGISAKNYDLYALEANYDEERVYEVIREKESKGEYAHQKGAVNSHLSLQQAQNFVIRNAGEKYEFVMLHQSGEF